MDRNKSKLKGSEKRKEKVGKEKGPFKTALWRVNTACEEGGGREDNMA